MTLRHGITLIGTAGAGLAILALTGWLGGYRMNVTPSEPLGLWRIVPLDRPARVGDVVFICPTDTPIFRVARARGYLRNGLCRGGFAPLIKSVAAVAGARIEIGAGVTIDGTPLTHSLLHVTDAEGRALSPFAGGIAPPRTLFLHSEYAGSYDSRYFGPVPDAGLLGRAEPILTFDP